MAATLAPGPENQLGELMSRISEDCYSAGWLHDIEWVLWRALLEWRQFGRADWPHSAEFGDDLAVWMWELDWLQKQAGGWVWWLDGMRFVSEERWQRLLAARETDWRLRDSNTLLDQAVAQ